MAVRTLITNQGLQLLADSSYASGQYYWIGYYALAYVPDFWKPTNASTITFPANNCGQVNDGNPVTPNDVDKITPTMTRLTNYGDMVWNIWQGDLTGGGYNEGGPAAELFNLAAYNTNVSKHYRYVLDENGNNLLVAWRKDPTSPEGKMIGAMVYYGTDGFMKSELPIPAPLYYLGDVTGKANIGDFFSQNTPTFKQVYGPYGNGADIYPYITVTLSDTSSLIVPKVSVDYRGYLDYNGGAAGWPPPPNPVFDAREIAPADPIFGGNVTAWFEADKTWEGESEGICSEFWKIHTISNYNRWHAPVNNIGFVINDDLAVRNMAKITKFFPISNYKVITTERGTSIDGQEIEVATSLGVEINLDLSPKTLAPGYNETGYYDENGNLGYFDLYSCDPNTNPSCTISPTNDLNGQPVYNTTHVSFKFNRIGLYALPILKAPYSIGDGEISNLTCVDVRLQYQINPDLEPILFAVVDWDNTVTLDNTGDGIHQFMAEINLNLASPNGVDCSVIRDSVIFYNMYEDDAQTWYKNQLVATASTQNAITEIGLEVGALMQKQINNENTCCPLPNLSLLTSNNVGNSGLRNLLDANQALDGGLKGIDTMLEGVYLYGNAYKLGLDSFVVGSGTAAMGDYSTVSGGEDNIISGSVFSSFIGGGIDNLINAQTSYSSIVGGNRNTITNPTKLVTSAISVIYGNGGFGGVCPYIITVTLVDAIAAIPGNSITITGTQQYNFQNATISTVVGNVITFMSNTLNGTITETVGDATINIGATTSVTNSAIVGGNRNSIEGDAYASLIGAGTLNLITGNVTASSILNGYANKISNANYTLIGSGINNNISASQYAIIASGYDNIISDTTSGGIFTGYQNKISGVGYSSVILGGVNNQIDVGANYVNGGAFIGAGSSNVIAPRTYDGYVYNSEESSIVSGKSNTISGSTKSFIGAGTLNLVDLSNVVSIIGGSENIVAQSDNSTIVGGRKNIIDSTGDSFIIGGSDNVIYKSGDSLIGNGSVNYIGDSLFSSIINGVGNDIYTVNYSTILNGCYVRADYTGEVIHNAITNKYPQQPNHSVIMYHYYSNDTAALNNVVFNNANYIAVGIDNTAIATYTDENVSGLSGSFIKVDTDETYAADVIVNAHMVYNGNQKSDTMIRTSILLTESELKQLGVENITTYGNIQHYHKSTNVAPTNTNDMAFPYVFPSIATTTIQGDGNFAVNTITVTTVVPHGLTTGDFIKTDATHYATGGSVINVTGTNTLTYLLYNNANTVVDNGFTISLAPEPLQVSSIGDISNVMSLGDGSVGILIGIYNGELYVEVYFNVSSLSVDELQVSAKFDGIYRKNT